MNRGRTSLLAFGGIVLVGIVVAVGFAGWGRDAPQVEPTTPTQLIDVELNPSSGSIPPTGIDDNNPPLALSLPLIEYGIRNRAIEDLRPATVTDVACPDTGVSLATGSVVDCEVMTNAGEVARYRASIYDGDGGFFLDRID